MGTQLTVDAITDYLLCSLVMSRDHFATRRQQCGQLSAVTNFNFIRFLLPRLRASCVVQFVIMIHQPLNWPGIMIVDALAFLKIYDAVISVDDDIRC